MSIKLEVWGDYACFSRPELKTERYSYDVMTPGAAVGILEAIFWHPGLHYEIDRIHVINPIRFTSVRRNEVKSKIGCSRVKAAIKKEAFDGLYLNTKTDIVQRAATVLKNVRYVIEAHFDIGPESNLSLIHISEPTRPSEISYAVFCLKKIFLMIRRPPRSTL